jgi:hypothetical protein
VSTNDNPDPSEEPIGSSGDQDVVAEAEAIIAAEAEAIH